MNKELLNAHIAFKREKWLFRHEKSVVQAITKTAKERGFQVFRSNSRLLLLLLLLPSLSLSLSLSLSPSRRNVKNMLNKGGWRGESERGR